MVRRRGNINISKVTNVAHFVIGCSVVDTGWIVYLMRELASDPVTRRYSLFFCSRRRGLPWIDDRLTVTTRIGTSVARFSKLMNMNSMKSKCQVRQIALNKKAILPLFEG